MNKVSKIFFLLAAMLLTAVVGAGVLSAAEVVVAENDVEWAATNGDNISSIKPGVTASFIVRDDALETTTGGTRTITLTAAAAAGAEFSIAAGTASAGTVSTTTLSAVGYNTGSPRQYAPQRDPSGHGRWWLGARHDLQRQDWHV